MRAYWNSDNVSRRAMGSGLIAMLVAGAAVRGKAQGAALLHICKSKFPRGEV
jgi:hypothetical protein